MGMLDKAQEIYDKVYEAGEVFIVPAATEYTNKIAGSIHELKKHMEQNI